MEGHHLVAGCTLHYHNLVVDTDMFEAGGEHGTDVFANFCTEWYRMSITTRLLMIAQ